MIPKFRAWDIENKKMHDVVSIWFDDYSDQHKLAHINVPNGETVDTLFDDYILMQSTEFPDKEGNEIWHKDILDESYTNPMTGELVVVRYIVEKENEMWKLKDFKGRQQYDRYLFMRNGQCTRIGNIYENPELLEVEG